MTRIACALLSLCSIVACTGGGSDDTGDDGGGDDAALTCELSPMAEGVSTLTGCSDPGMVDGSRGSAFFNNPTNVAVRSGTIYVADFDNGAIRKVTGDGETTTLVMQAGFTRPFGLAFASNGTLYVETDNNPDDQHSLTTGTLWRVDVGSGSATELVRDIGRPRGMVVLDDGRVVLSDYMHHVIKVFNPTTRAVTVLAGTLDVPGYADGLGAVARFRSPYGLVDLGDGSVAVADYDNHRIRRVTLTGEVTTLAGTGTAGRVDGAAASASFNRPQDLAIASDGTIYVSDADNFLIRRIRSGQVDTIIGSGTGGYQDSGDLRGAQLYGLEGIDLDGDGTLYIADGSRGEAAPHHRIRRAMLP